MILLLKEVDNFIKGDGKPFNAEENVFRNFDLSTLNINLFSNLKKKNPNVVIKNFHLYDKVKNDILIPLPKDLVLNKKNLIKAKLKKINRTYIIKFEGNTKIKSVNGYIYLKNLEYYIFDEKNIFLGKDNIIQPLKETIKSGIKLNHLTRTTETGFLYFQKFANLRKDIEGNNDIKNIFILAEVENLSHNNNYDEIATFGGENKCFLFIKDNTNIEDILKKAHLTKEDLKELKEKIGETKYFKIILLTPTNYPPKIDGAELIAQLIGKPITFSGWFNVYEEKSKKKIASFPSRLFKLIPAGSVFYYKIEDDIAKNNDKLNEFVEELFNKYWLKPAFFVKECPYFEKLDDGTNPLGFGLSIIGVAQVEE